MAFRYMTHAAGSPSLIVDALIDANTARKHAMAEKVMAAMEGGVEGKTIAVLGLTFKPETDDMREGASLVIVPALQKAGAKLRLYDPQGMKEAAKYFSGDGITWCKDAYDAMDKADMLLVLTEWNEFRHIELKKVKSLLTAPLVVDLRNIYKRQDMMKHGFHYVSIGRQDVIPGQPWIADLNLEDEKAA